MMEIPLPDDEVPAEEGQSVDENVLSKHGRKRWMPNEPIRTTASASTYNDAFQNTLAASAGLTAAISQTGTIYVRTQPLRSVRSGKVHAQRVDSSKSGGIGLFEVHARLQFPRRPCTRSARCKNIPWSAWLWACSTVWRWIRPGRSFAGARANEVSWVRGGG